ncbi:MAG: MFS transporter, partial [Lentisphaerae bacterium]|nr:MFS transporter [Lentisphaerota bacterium]
MRGLREQAVAAAVTTPAAAAAGSSAAFEAACVRALPWQWAGTGLNTFFALWTFGGSVFLLFLSELGLPKVQIGVVLALFPFCGLLALGFAPVAARLGRKRVFLGCYGARKVVMAGLLLLPVVTGRLGRGAGVAWLMAVIALFAILRALAETAYYPWAQEAIPNRVRGAFGAVNTAVSTAAACVALVLAGRVISAGEGLGRFLWLIGAGCVLGVVSVAVMAPVPGGRPSPAATDARAYLAAMRAALRDRNFRRYLEGMGCVTVGTLLFTAFLPLYVRDRLGVAADVVVTLDTAVMLGSALGGLACGWAADRLGSRPVLMPALFLNLLVPLGWMILPRQTPHAVVWCAMLYAGYGIAGSAVGIAAGRLLFNGVIPPERNTAYTAIYYAWMGLTGGAAPLLAGALLEVCGERSAALG